MFEEDDDAFFEREEQEQESEELDVTERVAQKYMAMVRAEGHPVHLHTNFCKGFLKTHENCKGCESQQGCSRVNKMLEAHAYIEGKIEKAENPFIKMAAIQALHQIHKDILQNGVIPDERKKDGLDDKTDRI